jgi:hypothetical protein
MLTPKRGPGVQANRLLGRGRRYTNLQIANPRKCSLWTASRVLISRGRIGASGEDRESLLIAAPLRYPSRRWVELFEFSTRVELLGLRIIDHGVGENRRERAHLIEARNLLG